ncbi:hypothetical protein ABE38_24640 [Brevibacillus agri]|nr:hypothetical protein [Brevibacillus agri]
MDSKYVTKEQLAKYLNVSIRTITRYQDEGMPFHKPSSRKNLYDVREVDEWIKKRKDQLLR